MITSEIPAPSEVHTAPEPARRGRKRVEREPELLPHPAPDRRLDGLARGRVPAAGVRPDPGEGPLVQRSPRDEQPTRAVEHVAREGEVE